jgi:hypothetical protein
LEFTMEITFFVPSFYLGVLKNISKMTNIFIKNQKVSFFTLLLLLNQLIL